MIELVKTSFINGTVSQSWINRINDARFSLKREYKQHVVQVGTEGRH